MSSRTFETRSFGISCVMISIIPNVHAHASRRTALKVSTTFFGLAWALELTPKPSPLLRTHSRLGGFTTAFSNFTWTLSPWGARFAARRNDEPVESLGRARRHCLPNLSFIGHGMGFGVDWQASEIAHIRSKTRVVRPKPDRNRSPIISSRDEPQNIGQ